jgi:ribosome-associated protein
MQATQMQKLITATLAEAKGQDIRVLDVRLSAGFTDYMVIASGTSSRHVQTLADKVIEALRRCGRRPLGVEGEAHGDWVLIDFGEVVTHVMRPQTRDFYGLEKLWGEIEAIGTGKPPPRRRAAKAGKKTPRE